MVDEAVELDEDILDDEPICEDDHLVYGDPHGAPACTILARARLSYACTNEVVLACKSIAEYVVKTGAICTCGRKKCLTVTWF